MTLLELLVAMVVLLVGIWTIAAGFPTLLASIKEEGQTTEMARFAERNMQRMISEEGSLPSAITGGPTISPYAEPDDLSNPGRGPNAVESILDVIGESFRIPGAQAAGSVRQDFSHYVLKQGPALWEDTNGAQTTSVYVLVPLTQQRLDPRVTGNPLLENSYYVDTETGEIIVPREVTTSQGADETVWDMVNSSAELLVNYAWAEQGGAVNRPPVHYVQAERAVDATVSANSMTFIVRAAKLTSGDHIFDRLIAGKTKVQALLYFQREPFGVAVPQQRGHYVQENNYGVMLKFHPEDAGLNAYVDYRLRTQWDTNAVANGQNRRKLMMIEDHVINSESTRTNAAGDPFTDINLVADNINTEWPTFAYQPRQGGNHELLTDVGLDTTHVLAVDLTTGEMYTDWLNLQLVNTDLTPALEEGYKQGIVCLPIGPGYDYVGHTMRFYYSTFDHHNVQMQKPPRTYVDLPTATAYTAEFTSPAAEPGNLVQVDYRTYQVVREATSITDMDRIILQFRALIDSDDNPGTPPELVEAVNSQGFQISVDYVWYDPADEPHYVYGEMHSVPQGSSRIVLDNLSFHRSDTYISAEIMAVRGVSSRSVVWWQSRTGRQEQMALDSYTLRNPLSMIQRTR